MLCFKWILSFFFVTSLRSYLWLSEKNMNQYISTYIFLVIYQFNSNIIHSYLKFCVCMYFKFCLIRNHSCDFLFKLVKFDYFSHILPHNSFRFINNIFMFADSFSFIWSDHDLLKKQIFVNIYYEMRIFFKNNYATTK